MTTFIGSNHLPIEHIIVEDDDFDDFVIAVSITVAAQLQCVLALAGGVAR
ncbi:uncharacterized protein CPUR_08174 [Claviceps purpurea 20.1]|uniref:Uncharacterized protein n=1 Tax=Claviceps purpurea (strain 20.1) TaxID=1111077 RepID=M1VYP2_CLAP2|nr:uncharacterized protein CPUR_08174 [Claviceps purpurea 20.1]